MNIELNRQESEQLLELAYLADWMANGIHPEEGSATYAAVLQKLYAAAEEDGLGYLIETDEETGDLRPSEALESRIDTADTIGHYDDHVFWDELSLRLAERDLKLEIGAAAYEALRPAERDEQVDLIAERYDQEFDKRGLDRVRLEGGLKKGKKRGDGLGDKLRKLFEE